MKARLATAALVSSIAVAIEDYEKMVAFSSDGTTTTMFETATPSSTIPTGSAVTSSFAYKWTMNHNSYIDPDTGIEYLRLEHELEGNIREDVEISFSLAYTTASNPVTNPKTLAEDGAVCKVMKNTNTEFWTQTAEDKKYVCSAYECNVVAITFADLTVSDDTTNDWTVPIEDDDENDPFCYVDSTDSDFDSSTFACQKIKCIIQRQFDTGDEEDFSFSPRTMTDSKDYMYIRPGRAFLGINTVTSGSVDTTNSMPINVLNGSTTSADFGDFSSDDWGGLKLEITKGATQLLAGASALAVAATLLSF